MMNRVLILLLTLLTIGIPAMQAQPATRDKLNRDAVQLKSTPLKLSQVESLTTANRQGVEQNYFWDFENNDHGWASVDRDGDGHSWETMVDREYAHSGTQSMMSASYINYAGDPDSYYGPLQPDNWLISPQVPLSGTLSIYAKNMSGFYPDRFAVYVCAGNSNWENYVNISNDNIPSTEWTEYTYDLSQYAGQMGYIAIRHYNSYDMWMLYIDDISITYAETPRPIITVEDTGNEIVVTATGQGYIKLYIGDTIVAEGEDCVVFTILYGPMEEEYSIAAYAQADGMLSSEAAVAEVVVPAIPMIELPAPVITYELTDDGEMLIYATGEGIVTLYVQYFDNWTGESTTESYVGDGYASVTIPRTFEYRFVNVWATAEMDGAYPGVSHTEFIEIPPLDPISEITETPVIECIETDDGVFITATGNGTICLYIYDELVAFDEGYVEYFIPSEFYDGMEYAVTATAQEDGKEVSEYAYVIVYVRGYSHAPIINIEAEDGYFIISAQPFEYGEVFLFANDEPVENPYIVYITDEEQHFVFSAYAIEEDHKPSVMVYEELVIIPESPILDGDADGDGQVTISDVTILIDRILTGDFSGINLEAADVNNDLLIDVSDITALIDFLLTGSR